MDPSLEPERELIIQTTFFVFSYPLFLFPLSCSETRKLVLAYKQDLFPLSFLAKFEF